MDGPGELNDVVDALVLALVDQRAPTRWAAVAALGRLHRSWRADAALAERSIEPLLALDGADHDDHLQQVLLVFARLAPDVIKRCALGHSNALVRGRAVRCLKSLPRAVAAPVVATLLQDSDADVVWEAAEWLAASENPACLPALLIALDDPKRGKEAALLLAKLPSPAAITPLVQAWAAGNGEAATALALIDPDWRQTTAAQEGIAAAVASWAEAAGGKEERARALDELDPAWPQRPEARVAVGWLIEAWAHGNDACFALLERIDLDWRRLAQAREQLSSLVRRWIESVTVVQRDRYGRQTSVEATAAERAAVETRLVALDARWQQSPEVQVLLPSLIDAWAKRWSVHGPEHGEAELRALLAAVEPGWAGLPPAVAHRDVLIGAWARGHDVVELLDAIDANWRRSSAARDQVDTVANRWFEKEGSRLDEELDVISPDWRKGKVEQIMEDYGTKRSRYYERSTIDETARRLGKLGSVAVDRLVADLRSSETYPRFLAAEQLVAMRMPRAPQLLAELLADRALARRESIVTMVGALGDHAFIPVLAEISAPTDPERPTAIEAIAKIVRRTREKDDKKTDDNSVDSRDWLCRDGAARTLALLVGTEEGEIQAVAADLAIEVAGMPARFDAPLGERVATVEVLATSMAELAFEEEPRIRMKAAKVAIALLALDDSSLAARTLLVLLAHDPNSDVRLATTASMGAIGLGDRAALLKSGWPMLRRALGHGRSEPRQAAVEAVAFLLEPAPTDGEADSPFDDLVALGRRDDAARALLEGVLPTLERRGEYRRCLEVQARLDRVHAESPPLGTAALSAMSSVRAGYLWALGDAPAALNAAKVAASTLMATAPVDEQRSSDMSAIGDHRSWDDLDLPAIEGFAEGQSFEEEFMK